MLVMVKGKLALPVALMVVFALSRIPGMLPQNFSAAYALAFCAGVYFSRGMAWWLPLGTLLVTDIGLNLYYLHLGWSVFELPVLKYQLFNYAAYLGLIWLGRTFKPKSSFIGLLGGGILGWLTALTKGTSGWPETWQFFRNTLMSGGLFTGLFVGAMKLSEASESKQEKEEKAPEEADGEGAVEEGKA